MSFYIELNYFLCLKIHIKIHNLGLRYCHNKNIAQVLVANHKQFFSLFDLLGLRRYCYNDDVYEIVKPHNALLMLLLNLSLLNDFHFEFSICQDIQIQIVSSFVRKADHQKTHKGYVIYVFNGLHWTTSVMIIKKGL